MKKTRAKALRMEGWKKVRESLNKETHRELYNAVDSLIKENEKGDTKS